MVTGRRVVRLGSCALMLALVPLGCTGSDRVPSAETVASSEPANGGGTITFPTWRDGDKEVAQAALVEGPLTIVEDGGARCLAIEAEPPVPVLWPDTYRVGSEDGIVHLDVGDRRIRVGQEVSLGGGFAQGRLESCSLGQESYFRAEETATP